MSPPVPTNGAVRRPERSAGSGAGRGFVLVFVGALIFFGFVIGSELLGAAGQAALSFVVASGALLWLWSRLDPGTRQRLRLQARHLVRPSSRP
jgi:hypothetical protein